MKTERDLVCIRCPLGCRIHVELEEDQVVAVTGNTCPNGDQYARKEVTAPTRMVTSTVRVEGSYVGAVPVKTASDIPKEMISQCIAELKGVVVKAPVKAGDIIVPHICGTEVAVIATGDAEASGIS